MFTGLIEEVGTIVSAVNDGDGRHFTISAPHVITDIHVDDSIAVNGCCLTVTHHDETTFSVTAVAETLRKTTLGTLHEGSRVNLERAVRLMDRLGGHMVQGHVDTTGTIDEIFHNDNGWEVWCTYPASYAKWLIPVGSICMEGVSLTIAELSNERFKIAVIPHTLERTTLGRISVGSAVNLEFDMIAKYITTHLERLTTAR